MKTKPVKSADPIGEFYTNHPYPPPIDNLDRARDMWQDEQVHRAELHLLSTHKDFLADLVLHVEGCGTWHSANFAVGHPNARLSAIHISTMSIELTAPLNSTSELTILVVQQLP